MDGVILYYSIYALYYITAQSQSWEGQRNGIWLRKAPAATAVQNHRGQTVSKGVP